VTYQHPLAYLLAVEGMALMRAFGGEHGRDFTRARLAAALAEFVRVLRPGGHLVISDSRGQFGPIPVRTRDGGPGLLPHWNHLPSDYLVAALPLGLQVRRCVEPRRPAPLVDPNITPARENVAARDFPSAWDLHTFCPAATNAAYEDTPAAIIWHFRLGDTAASRR